MGQAAALRKEKDSFWTTLIDQLTDDLRSELAEGLQSSQARPQAQQDAEPRKPGLESLVLNYRLTNKEESKTKPNRQSSSPRPSEPSQRRPVKTESEPVSARILAPPLSLVRYTGVEAIFILSRLEALGARFRQAEVNRELSDGVAICKKALHRERVRMLIRLHPDHGAPMEAAPLLQEGIDLFRKLAQLIEP